MTSTTQGLLPDRETRQLREALQVFTVDSVHELLGPAGQAALGRTDFAGVSRYVGTGHDRVTTFMRLFLLAHDVELAAARTALAPLPVEAAAAAGIIEVSGDRARALIDIRPYAEQLPELPGEGAVGATWWVVSDFGSDVRAGRLADDHVLGIGTASLTLAQTTPRDAVATALDVGTGSGVQALHLARHAGRVVATDVSTRALRMAATTAALSGQRWELRAGSLLEPVVDDRFDLVVANPPFVVSPGRSDVSGWEYRDGGGTSNVAGDSISEQLIRSLPGVLSENGSAHLLANWLIPRSGEWRDRVGSWVHDNACDAWVWQREVAEPGEYVALWLRDSGLSAGTAEWRQRYDAWLDWFASVDAVAVGMGMVSLWRAGGDQSTVVLEDVPQALDQPIGAALPAWQRRARWLARTDDRRLFDARLRAADGLVLDRAELLGTAGWQPATTALRQSAGMRWQVDVDEAVAGLVAASDGNRPLSLLVSVLAATSDRSTDDVTAALGPVVRDLVQRGFLIPEGLA